MVERLVGSHFHWLFLASLSEIVSARSMLFVLTVVEGPLIARMPIYSDPTSRVTVAPLAARKVDPVVQCGISVLRICFLLIGTLGVALILQKCQIL